ncbi:MAG TPA: CARDB domain-containing protein [Pyrinomonadaceae bacterium]|nr:CARDB domain-containing protein [Pyrinomonadaceae bacterium]
MPKSISRTSIALLAITFLSIMPVNTQTARAQEQSAFPFQYAVAFVCGKAINVGQFQRMARTTYFTAIYVHNPLVGNVSFRKKVALRAGFFVGQPNIKPFTNNQLQGDGVVHLSCQDITLDVFQSLDEWAQRLLLEGFVVIESRVELDVVAEYTTENSESRSQRVTMNLERVPVRRLALPDLVPIPDAKGNFCRRDENGRLIVTIQNQGLADAGASITRVDFSPGGGHQLITTPAIPAGGSVDVFVTFPPLCFRPDCTFRIAADSTGFVSESDEFNNAAGGTCKG